jgi:hypothetical protein
VDKEATSLHRWARTITASVINVSGGAIVD